LQDRYFNGGDDLRVMGFLSPSLVPRPSSHDIKVAASSLPVSVPNFSDIAKVDDAFRRLRDGDQGLANMF
jgi:hypothetical protein